MTGCTTSICVESTIRDAFFRDYHCVVLEDCTAEPMGASLSRSNHDATILLVERIFGSVSTSSNFIDALHAALAAYGSGPPAVGSGAATGVEAVAPGEPRGLGAPRNARGLGGAAQDAGERAALPSAPDVNDELAELIDRQPDEVAAILRGWLADRRA